MPFSGHEKKHISDILDKYKNGDRLWEKEDYALIEEVISRRYEDFTEMRKDYLNQQRYYVDAALGRNGKKDYSHLKDIAPLWSSFYASGSIYDNERAIFSDLTDIEKFLKQKYLFNPFFRHGIELASRAENDYGSLTEGQILYCKKVDSSMNEQILRNTLAPVTVSRMKTLHLTDYDNLKLIEKNVNAVTTLAKSLFMAHLGGFYIVDNLNKPDPKTSSPYTGNMADTLAHGGRLMFIWAKKDGQTTDNMTDSFLGKGEKRAAFDRSAGTHSVTIIPHENSNNEIIEKKGIFHASLFNNYGMNLAVGGFGKFNPGAAMIKNDGKNGHMYAHILESKADQNGVMLMGIEGSAPGKRDFAGNLHDFRGLSSPFSPFMGDKLGGSGAKLGGRRIDLTMYREKDLMIVLNYFGEYYSQMQRNAVSGDPDALQALNELNKTLSGTQLSEALLKNILTEMVNSPFMRNCKIPGSFLDALKNRDTIAKNHFGKMDQRYRKKTPLTTAALEKRIKESQKEIYGKGSAEFRRMREELNIFAAVMAEIPNANAGMQHTYKMAVYAQNLIRSAQAYINLKKDEKEVSGKTRTRLDIARDIITLASDYSAYYQEFMDSLKVKEGEEPAADMPVLNNLPTAADIRLTLNSAYAKAFNRFNDPGNRKKPADAEVIFNYYEKELFKPGADCSAMYICSGIAASLLQDKMPEYMKNLSVKDLFANIAASVKKTYNISGLAPETAALLLKDHTFLHSVKQQIKTEAIRNSMLGNQIRHLQL